MEDAYKLHYINRVREAANDYINWSVPNTAGIRFITRFHHFCHGASGEARARQLLADTLDPNKTFYDIVKLVGEAQLSSGITQHSLKRYLYQAFTKNPVIGTTPKVSDEDFFNQSHRYLTTEFENLFKRQDLKEFSCLALTEGVRVASKHSTEEFTLKIQTSLSALSRSSN
jgi:hypothetical protein